MHQSGLHVVKLSVSRDRAVRLENFDGHEATWVVADVRSKLAIQRRLLEKKGFAEGLAVLRASELWTHALKRLQPDLQIVSRELILASLAARLRDRPEPWLHAPGAAKTAFEYIKQLLPILASEATAADIGASFDDWFEQDENLASKDRWQQWYQIAKSAWIELCGDRLCATSWVPGALAAVKSQLVGVIDRDLTIDLGAELSHLEADLLLEIAKTHRVTVFRPTPDWESDYPDGRLAVDWMIKAAKTRDVEVSIEDRTRTLEVSSIDKGATNEGTAAVIYKRLPSGTAEVKEAVARVRKWLEDGVAPSRIGLVAPDLEAYWPVLSLHLEVEGIPAAKPVVSMLHSFSDVMRWLARLRIRVGIPEPRDLEADLFGEANPPLTFVSFREIFSRVYEAADLELSRELQDHFASEFKDRGRWRDDEIVGRDVFLARALAVLREGDEPSRAIRLFKTVLEECPPDITFDCLQWVKYLGELAARIEVPVLVADPFGIACLNLASLEGVECTHVVVMGLHESAMRSQHGTTIHTFDLRSIEKQTGFVIDGEDRKRVEFEARWILSQPRIETHLLFADADLGGTVQTPSWSWISGAWAKNSATPEIEVALETRFDLLQTRDAGIVGSKAQRERTRREAGLEPQPNFGAGLISSLSATTIDQVSKCALRFAFDRVLGPRNEGILDLDADSSRHGRLQHKIFELLGKVQWKAHTDEELQSVIETARETIEAADEARIVRTEQAWLSLKRRLLKVARWILEFEREQRRRFPALRTVGSEVSFKGTVEARSNGESATRITGQIDRIDWMPDATTGHGRLILVDYKNRAAAQNFSTWRSKNFWQPLVYAMAFEKGWIQELSPEETAARLAGIFIYDIRDRSRGTGLRLREGNEDIFDFTARSKGQSREDLEKAFADLEETIKTVTEKISTGGYRPEPADTKECLRCRWRSSCRAPHLELM